MLVASTFELSRAQYLFRLYELVKVALLIEYDCMARRCVCQKTSISTCQLHVVTVASTTADGR